jgi:hypothetical protein
MSIHDPQNTAINKFVIQTNLILKQKITQFIEKHILSTVESCVNMYQLKQTLKNVAY